MAQTGTRSSTAQASADANSTAFKAVRTKPGLSPYLLLSQLPRNNMPTYEVETDTLLFDMDGVRILMFSRILTS